MNMIAQNVAKQLFERSLAWPEGSDLPEDKDLIFSSGQGHDTAEIFGNEADRKCI
jgi:hypothetical protein